MSELIFGPSAEWLPLSGLQGECLQPRLDGGYDYRPAKKFGNFVFKSLEINTIKDPNQPSLFDEYNEEYPESPTLFDIE